jgi:nitrite reductase/ring-hydroxylating ferredoxin subunit
MSDPGWTPVIRLEELPLERATRFDLDGLPILLYRTDEKVFAVGARCTHQGAPLDRGRIRLSGSEATVTCPAHGSVFRLTDGAVVRSPASAPVQAFEVRVASGTIELRSRS